MKKIFGPVASRRLGRSLGVDLIPFKTCSYDCVYCEVGKTTDRTMVRKGYVSREEILSELKVYLKNPGIIPDFITIGGSGEPTLNAHLGRIISDIKAQTDIPVAVLTNGSLLYQDDVKEELLQANVVLPSLDAVSPSVFEMLNRPHPSLDIQTIIRGLINFRKVFTGEIWLEILFCLGMNDTTEEIQKLKNAVRQIKPDRIQLNTVDRPPAEENTLSISIERLKEIKNNFGSKAEIITGFLDKKCEDFSANAEKRILEMLRRRPCTEADISLALGIHQRKLEGLLDSLQKKGKLRYRIFNNRGYYQVQ